MIYGNLDFHIDGGDPFSEIKFIKHSSLHGFFYAGENRFRGPYLPSGRTSARKHTSITYVHTGWVA